MRGSYASNIFSFLSGVDIFRCGRTCMQCLNILENDFNWEEYCALVRMPLTLYSLTMWQTYYSHVVVLRNRLLEYKYFLARHLGFGDLTLDEHLTARLNTRLPCCFTDRLFNQLSLFGTLPMDYIAFLHLLYAHQSLEHPDPTLGLGDIRIMINGIPVSRHTCKDPVTNICAMGIGYVDLACFEEHRTGIDYDVHEIIMSFHVNKKQMAEQVQYSVVCHCANSIGRIQNAVALVAKFGSKLHDLDTDDPYGAIDTPGWNSIFVRTFDSYAELVAECTCQHLPQNSRQPRHSCFIPCFRFWASETDTDPPVGDDDISVEFGLADVWGWRSSSLID